jgi:hypothetical protein
MATARRCYAHCEKLLVAAIHLRMARSPGLWTHFSGEVKTSSK